MKRVSAALAISAGLLFTTPASAQALLGNWSLDQMKDVVTGIEDEITDSGADEEGKLFIRATDGGGLNYEVRGAACSTAGSATTCDGAQLVAWFTLSDDDAVWEAVDMFDYMAVTDDNWGDNVFALSRYLIFDGGISRENLKVNLNVFLNISHDVWDQLSEEGFFE